MRVAVGGEGGRGGVKTSSRASHINDPQFGPWGGGVGGGGGGEGGRADDYSEDPEAEAEERAGMRALEAEEVIFLKSPI
jgi:hypothetical protein